jgi:predicted Zn-dependent protease
VRLNHARALRAAGDQAGARSQLEAALQASPHHAAVQLELADLLLADGEPSPEAAALLADVPPGAPGRELVEARLAEALGFDDAAEDAYARQLLRFDDPEVRLRRAVLLERLSRPTEAVAELERLVQRRPDHLPARLRLAELLERVGRTEAAEAELRALAESSPGRPGGWRRLARFLERIGHTAKARAADARAETAARPRRQLRPLLPSSR